MAQSRKIGFALLEEDGLGDLKLKALGKQARGSKRRANDLRQVALFKLHRRKIDCDSQISRPFHRLSAGLPQDPLAQRHDKASFLGERDEFGRRDEPALGAAPAQLSLKSRNRSRLKTDEGLVKKLE